MNLKTCPNCGNPYVKGKRGYCGGCGNYLRIHGRLPQAHEMHKRLTEFAPCTNCGQDLAISRNTGLCNACTHHQRRHGTPRIVKQKVTICRRCHERKPVAKGLCAACYHYQKVNKGKPRPRRLWADKVCKTCGRPNVKMTKGECRTCYEYRWLYGKERPAHLWQKWNPTIQPKQRGMQHCIVCGKPCVERARQRCRSCYSYWWKHHRDRPAQLWQRGAPYGWCDCGAPAVTEVTLSVNQGVQTYKLCRDCYQLEVEK
jgi:hypothetical protein